MKTTTAYGPRTTRKLQNQWRALAGTNTPRLRSATKLACSTGLRPGTGRWYAAALWAYSQH